MRIQRSVSSHVSHVSHRALLAITAIIIALAISIAATIAYQQYISYGASAAPGDPTSEACFATTGTTSKTITNYYSNENNDVNQPACPRDVEIPSTIDGVVVTTIESAFYNNQLTSVSIAHGVTSIGDGAFAFNKLTEVTIPGSVTSIGDGAFAFNKLTEVTIPGSVTSISPSAFVGQNPWGGDVDNCIDSGGEALLSSVGDDGQVLGVWTSDTAPCLASDDPDEAKVVLDNIWYTNLTLADGSSDIYSSASYGCLGYDDDPDSPQCTTYVNIGGHIINGAALNLHYVDQTNNSLRTTQTFVGRLDDGSYITNYYANQGPNVPAPDDPFDPTPAELAAIDQALSASYFQIGDTVTIDPPAIAGYITPPVQTFVLGASINNETYVYSQGAAGADEERLAETGANVNLLVFVAATAAAVGGYALWRR